MNKKTVYNKRYISEIKDLWNHIYSQIEKRILEFKWIWEHGSDKEIFSELIFCIFTPQSKAISCAKALDILNKKGLLYQGTPKQISRYINNVRFRNNKAKYLYEARQKLLGKGKIEIKKLLLNFNNAIEARDWLIKNIKGIGMKEASHFLRNIGFNFELAILDRHILKNLYLLGVIDSIPDTLNKRTYLDIEDKMKRFAKDINIPIGHLDLLLWYKETGKIFK